MATVFYTDDPDVIMPWLAAAVQPTSFTGRLTCPTPLQTLLLYTQVQYQKGTGGSYVEKPAETASG
jgi:hypothetical protein